MAATETLRLKELRIYRRERYVDRDEPLYGILTFEGQYGETTLKLDERLSQQIVELCADQVAASAAEIADNLRADARSIMAALPKP